MNDHDKVASQYLIDFIDHLRKAADEMMETGRYDEKYNLSITCNDKSVELYLHADLYWKVQALLKEELEDLRG